MVLNNLRHFLYVQRPKSSDLLIGIISTLLGLIAFSTRYSTNPGGVIRALEQVATIEIWGLSLVAYGLLLVFCAVTNYTRFTIRVTAAGTFIWFGVVMTLLIFQQPANAIVNGVIYGTFAIFSMWSFLNAQEEQRMKQKYGANYRQLLEQQILDELESLRVTVEEMNKEIDGSAENRA